MSNPEKNNILQRVRKLLALGQSPNENEAAEALSKASELMEQYNLSQTDVNLAQVGQSDVATGKYRRPPSYAQGLAEMVSDIFGVDFYFRAQRRRYWRFYFCFVGVRPNEEIASYAFEVLHKRLRGDRKRFMDAFKTSPKRKSELGDAYAVGWVAAVEKKVAKLVPKKDVPEVVGEYLQRMRDEGSLSGVTESRETVKRNNGAIAAAMSEGYEDGTQVDIRHGMGGKGEVLGLN